ncbi:hypothetical protein ACX2CK_06530 [Acinetobacter schindleri]
MKRIILLAVGLVGVSTSAQEIYILKTSDGSTLLTAKEPTEEKYGKFAVEKKTYYPEWSPLDWNYACSKDKFDGKKSCSLNKSHSDVMVGIFDGQHSVYVGRDHYPRSQSAIKVDSNAPIYGYEGSSDTPKKVIEQMKKGKVAYTRYREWPYNYNQDGEVDLTGFAEKYNEMLEKYREL